MIIDSDNATGGENIPVACTLTAKAANEQVLEWVDLQKHVIDVAAIDAGVRMVLPAAMASQVEDLARRESNCCAFLAIDTSVDGDHLTLSIRSENPDALPVIEALAGIAPL